MKLVRTALFAAAVLAAAGALFIANPYDLWILLYLAVFLGNIVLAVVFPAYFCVSKGALSIPYASVS